MNNTCQIEFKTCYFFLFILTKLIFKYLIIKLCFSEVLAPETLLRDLFENDLGEESPNPTNHYQLRQLELGSFGSLLDQLGYPYLWVQRICGLDFIPGKVSF